MYYVLFIIIFVIDYEEIYCSVFLYLVSIYIFCILIIYYFRKVLNGFKIRSEEFFLGGFFIVVCFFIIFKVFYSRKVIGFFNIKKCMYVYSMI